jgi:hypothetical protein
VLGRGSDKVLGRGSDKGDQVTHGATRRRPAKTQELVCLRVYVCVA